MFMSPSVQRMGALPGRSGVGGFTLDMTEVLGRMRVLDKVMFLKVNAGLKLAGLKFMDDTVVGLPSTPIRRASAMEPTPYNGKHTPGALRGSGTVFVGRIVVGTSGRYGTPEFQTRIYGGTPLLPMNPQACLSFNAPYAAKQHEAFALKTEPTAGMYFLSTKLYGNGNQYMGIVARAIRL